MQQGYSRNSWTYKPDKFFVEHFSSIFLKSHPNFYNYQKPFYMEPLISVDLVSGCQRFQIQLICHHYAVIAGPVNSSTLIHPSHRAENPDTCCVSRASAIYFHLIRRCTQTSYFVLIYPLGFSFITNNYSWSLTHPNLAPLHPPSPLLIHSSL